MAQFPADKITEVKPQSNIYTVMMIIAIVAMITSIALVILKLTGDPSGGGYGLSFGEIFKPFEK